MPNIIQKSTEQKEAEAEVKDFKNNLGPFVVAAESTRMAMVFTDAKDTENPIIFANDSYLELTGYTRQEVLGQKFNFLLADGVSDQSFDETGSLNGRTEEGAEILYHRKDGSQFWAAVFIHPVQDEDGTLVQYFASFVDLTKHKNEQTKSNQLIEELNHRVKNTLATVQSIVWQALRNTSDPAEIKEAIESRLFAMSRSHDLLTQHSWQSATMLDIAHDALAPFSLKDGDTDRITIGLGEDVRVPPKVTLALGLALNELATNATKYGALSNETGRLLVQWTVVSDTSGQRLAISWQESDGPPVSPPKRRGFGSQVLERGLAMETGAEVTLNYLPPGLHCTINIPLAGDRHA